MRCKFYSNEAINATKQRVLYRKKEASL